MNPGEIHYKVPWRAIGSYPGHHSSQQKGGGLQFRNHVPLMDAPDPRRFDIRASLRDPFGQIRVRVYQQTSSIPVFIVADLSASMAYKGAHSKSETLAEFVRSLSYSAYRTGDAFGFVGCGERHSELVFLPSTLNRGSGMALAEQLRGRTPAAGTSEGLIAAAEHLGSRRALVFLVSDFHFPTDLLDRVLGSLALHDVVPVMLWDRREYEDLPKFGIVRVFDRETNRHRMLWMRPALRERIEERFARRRERLFELFAQYGRSPIVLQDGFSADEVTHYFYQ